MQIEGGHLFPWFAVLAQRRIPTDLWAVRTLTAAVVPPARGNAPGRALALTGAFGHAVVEVDVPAALRDDSCRIRRPGEEGSILGRGDVVVIVAVCIVTTHLRRERDTLIRGAVICKGTAALTWWHLLCCYIADRFLC